MKRRTFLKLGAGTAVGTAVAGCGANDAGDGAATDAPASSNVVAGWTRTAIEAVRAVKPGPPMAARSFAVLHTCMYNTWCAFDTRAVPHHGSPVARVPAGERTAASKAAALSHAAHLALLDQYPGQKERFDAHLRSLGYEPDAAQGGASTASAAARIGIAVARAELDWCHEDGANQLGKLTPSGVPYADYTGYAPRNPPLLVTAATPREAIPAPDRWQPLAYPDAAGVVRTQTYLAACWDRVKPFALASAAQFRPAPPAAFGSPEYAEQARRIVALQAGLTDQQKVIAEYWADGPSSELPPGHWLLFGLHVAQRDGHRDDEDVRLFFALSNALADAAIAAWDAKRAYDSARPITAVRYLRQEETLMGYGPGGAASLRPIAGSAWLPYQALSFPTPPFAEHVSGHSTFSAAAAEVLRRFTGSDRFGLSHVQAAHSLQIEPGAPAAALTLDWPTFTDAEEQAGMSRLYGGIHFDRADSAGRMLGRQVGSQAFARAEALWQGAV